MARADGDFDPVGLTEISEMTGESEMAVSYLMGLPGAPEPARLARGKVWPRAEAVAYLDSLPPKGPDGRRPGTGPGTGRESVTVSELKDGMVIIAGTVTAVRYSGSGRTAYVTVRDAGGQLRELLGRPASGKIIVLTAGDDQC